MFKTVHEAVAYTKELRQLLHSTTGVDVVAAPPFTAVHAVAEAARNSPIAVAGQDVYWEKEGAFTGEVSAGMLREAGAEYAIVGHSERRRLFGETDATVNRKIRAAYANDLVPIACIGETLEEREAGTTLTVLDRQISEGLDGLTGEQLVELVIAYEPVWAIGTGQTATPEQAEAVHAFIRGLVAIRSARIASQLRILYGGSVKGSNARALFAMPDIDGGLVGGASLDAADFLLICSAASGHS
jgi:triosephosphate isomerase